MISSKIQFIKRWGPVKTLYSLFMRNIRKILPVNFSVVVCRPLPLPNGKLKKPDGIQLAVLTEQQLMAWCKHTELDLHENIVKHALKRGDYCIGATEKGKPVAYVWRAFSDTPHVRSHNIWIAIGDSARYGYNSLTLPQYRGRHIQPALSALGDELIPDHGKKISIGFIETDNYPSIRAALTLGSKIVGYAGYIIIFGKFLSFASPGAKKVGFRFYQSSRPEIPASNKS